MAVGCGLNDEGICVCSMIEEHGGPVLRETMCNDRLLAQNIMGRKGTVWLALEGISLGEHSTMNQLMLQQSFDNGQDIDSFLRANTASTQTLSAYSRRRAQAGAAHQERDGGADVAEPGDQPGGGVQVHVRLRSLHPAHPRHGGLGALRHPPGLQAAGQDGRAAAEAAKHTGVRSKKKTDKGRAKLSPKDKLKRKEAGKCAVTCVSVLVYYVHSILAHPLSTGGALCRGIYCHHSPRPRGFATRTNQLRDA